MTLRHNRRQFVQVGAASTLLAALGLSALAQALPVDLVKISNGFPVGGSADTTSRRIGEKLCPSAARRRSWQKTKKPNTTPGARLSKKSALLLRLDAANHDA